MDPRPGLRPLLAALLLPLTVAAQPVAITATTVTVRAGPESNYPAVVVLSPGVQVIVQGCVADYVWCDVAFGYERGWVDAAGLYYDYRSAFVPLPTVAARAGIPVVSFYIEEYWGVYYRARPWYGDWHRWEPWPGSFPLQPIQPRPLLPGQPPPGYRPPAVGQPAPAPRSAPPADEPRPPVLGRPSR